MSFRPSTFPFAIVFALLVATLAGSTGCASKPSMKLNHAEVSGVSLGFPPQIGVIITMVIDVYNPNSYDVAIRAMRGNSLFAEKYTLPLDYKAPNDGLWLAAKQTTTVRIPVTVPIDLALHLLRESYSQPTVTFHVTGTADVTATRTFQIEKDNYSIDESGTFARQQLEVAVPHL